MRRRLSHALRSQLGMERHATWGTFAEARSLLAPTSMIEWPDAATVTTPAGREGLDLVRASGACAELETSRERWRVAAWPWTREPPIRVGFVNDANDEVIVTLDEDGIWRLDAAPVLVRERTAEELEDDARGDLDALPPVQPART